MQYNIKMKALADKLSVAVSAGNASLLSEPLEGKTWRDFSSLGRQVLHSNTNNGGRSDEYTALQFHFPGLPNPTSLKYYMYSERNSSET